MKTVATFWLYRPFWYMIFRTIFRRTQIILGAFIKGPEAPAIIFLCLVGQLAVRLEVAGQIGPAVWLEAGWLEANTVNAGDGLVVLRAGGSRLAVKQPASVAKHCKLLTGGRILLERV
jgi:hypothetical protein